MFRLKQIKIKKTKSFFKKLPRFLAEKFFITFLIFVFFALVLGITVFYKFSVLTYQKKIETLEKPVVFNEKNLQEIIKIWQDRQKKFEESESKEYPNLFKITE